MGSAADGQEALELVGRLQPDAVLMDLSVPGMGGVEATRRLLDAHPGVQVVVLTSFSDQEQVLEEQQPDVAAGRGVGQPVHVEADAVVGHGQGDGVGGGQAHVDGAGGRVLGHVADRLLGDPEHQLGDLVADLDGVGDVQLDLDARPARGSSRSRRAAGSPARWRLGG